MSKSIDLTGQVFGRLTVVERATYQISPSGVAQPRWLCRCECGTVSIKRASHLRSGSTTTCGKCPRTSARLIDLTGQRFNRLIVVEQEESRRQPDGRSIVMWSCLCDCGSTTTVRAINLRSGKTQSCGCFWRERLADPRTKDIGYTGMHDRVRKVRGSATLQSCIDCGDEAMDWSCRRDVPHKISTADGLYYSTDIDAYDPRCRPCHKVYDHG